MAEISYLQIIRKCNNNCICCSNPSNANVFELDQIKEHLDRLKNDGTTDVILTGGEPTIHKDFFEILDYGNQIGLKMRVITNGIMLADEKFVMKLKDRVTIVHLSVYTYKVELNEWLRQTKGSYKNMVKAMLNLYKHGITTQTTTMVCKFNQSHLKQIIHFIRQINPSINHFIFNMLDPKMMTLSNDSLSAVPDLDNITDSLVSAFEYIESIGGTFRVERIPLCKIPGYEWANTECRKLVKNQQRTVVFLDDRGTLKQPTYGFRYTYASNCNSCKLFEICSGIYLKDTYYPDIKLPIVNDDNVLDRVTKKVNEY